MIKAKRDLPAQELLNVLQSIERKLGRVKTVLNGPRTIDLDILLYDQLKLQTSQLTIPHPRILERDFVMRPLTEIAPDLISAIFRNENGEPRQYSNVDGRS